MRISCLHFAAGAALWTSVAWGFAHAQVGSTIENLEMPTLEGSKHPLLSNAAANVFIFFKPGQEYSRATLKQLAVCEKEMAAKSVHWVAIVSDRFTKAEVEAEVKETGITMPVLIDVGDAFYGKLGVALCPVAGIADKNHKLVAYQPFTKVNYVAVIRARVRHLLGEINEQDLETVLKPPDTTKGRDAHATRSRLKLAGQLFQAGNHAKALEHVKKSLEGDPTQAEAHVLLGQILVAQGKPAEAAKAFAQALQLDPNNAKASDGLKACQAKNR